MYLTLSALVKYDRTEMYQIHFFTVKIFMPNLQTVCQALNQAVRTRLVYNLC